MPAECLFCQIAAQARGAAVVFEDLRCLAFLDHRPLLPGHVLLIPKSHIETLADLPATEIGPLFGNAQRLARAMEEALGAEGSFVAINNRVSQSVPHLHIHVVPRRRKDGLKGFFWPRGKYGCEEEMEAVRAKLEQALAGSRPAASP
ncbi:MAG: HIT family protein [Acidobacteriia bacterium]|nr:HIT family protein [Terriglobia bacterium]